MYDALIENVLIKNVLAALREKKKNLRFKPNSILTEVDIVKAMDTGNLSGVVSRITLIASRDINIIRDGIKPLVNSYATLVEEDVKRFLGAAPFSNLILIQADIPDFIQLMADNGDFDVENIDTSARTFGAGTFIEKPNMDALRQSIIGGYSDMNTAVGSYMSGVSDASLERIWENYFAMISGENINYAGLGTRVTDHRYGQDLFVAYLIIKTLINIPPEKVKGSFANYQMAITAFKNLLAYDINDFIRRYERSIRSGRLVYHYDDKYVTNKDFVVVVHKDNYNTYITEGGNPEVLYGAVLQENKGLIYIDTLVQNKDDFALTWNNFYKKKNIERKLTSSESYKMAYKNAVYVLLDEYIGENLKRYIDPEFIENPIPSLDNYFMTIDDKKLTVVRRVAIDIVAGIIFSQTNAHRFFKYMHQYEMVNPDMQPNETASYATAELISDFIAAQFEVI